MLGLNRTILHTVRVAADELVRRPRVKRVVLGAVGIGLVGFVVLLWWIGFAAVAAVPAVGLLFLVWSTSRLTGWTWVESTRRLFAVPIGLGSALLPLLLPVLVIATYAARVLEPEVQVAFGVLLAVLLGVALINERDGAQEIMDSVLPWRPGSQARVLRWIAATLALTVVVVLAVLIFGRGVYRFGGFSAVVELAGLVLLVAALLFRFASFRDDAAGRFLVHALMFVVLCAALVLWGHTSPPGDTPEVNASDAHEEVVLLWLLLGGFLLYSACEGGWRAFGRGTGKAPPWVGEFRRVGFLLALLSSLALVAAFGLALRDAQGSAPRERYASGLPVRPPTEMEDDELAATFLPALRFHSEESWWPGRVDPFVAKSTLYYLEEKIGPAGALVPRWTTCLDSTRWACRRLTCAAGDGACAQAFVHTSGEKAFLYARVVRTDRESTKVAHAGFVSGPRVDGERIEILVQYWLFYAHNRWSAFTPVGYLEQEHEGDWEAVTVALSGERPLFVAYSAHCGGTWERWGEIEALARPGEGDGGRATHPLVAVARGSHANYLQAWSGRPPDWASCRRLLPGEATWALTYASNVRDLTETTDAQLPDYELVAEDSPIMNFAGLWGASDVTRLRVLTRQRELQRGRGPTSPGLKDLWLRPVSTVLCRSAWEGPAIGGCNR